MQNYYKVRTHGSAGLIKAAAAAAVATCTAAARSCGCRCCRRRRCCLLLLLWPRPALGDDTQVRWLVGRPERRDGSPRQQAHALVVTQPVGHAPHAPGCLASPPLPSPPAARWCCPTSGPGPGVLGLTPLISRPPLRCSCCCCPTPGRYTSCPRSWWWTHSPGPRCASGQGLSARRGGLSGFFLPVGWAATAALAPPSYAHRACSTRSWAGSSTPGPPLPPRTPYRLAEELMPFLECSIHDPGAARLAAGLKRRRGDASRQVKPPLPLLPTGWMCCSQVCSPCTGVSGPPPPPPATSLYPCCPLPTHPSTHPLSHPTHRPPSPSASRPPRAWTTTKRCGGRLRPACRRLVAPRWQVSAPRMGPGGGEGRGGAVT